MSHGTADCPVAGCEFADIPSLVAAHVNGTDDADHDWQRLPYEGPGAFLSAARSGDAASGGSGTADTSPPDGTDSDGHGGTGEAATGDAGTEAGGDESSPADAARPFDPADALRAADVARSQAAGVDDLAALSLEDLVDLYVAFSVLSGEASSARNDLKQALVDRVDDDGELTGSLGAVERSTGTRRSLRDDATVREALFRAGVDPHDVLSFDASLVADAVADREIDEEAVFEVSETDRLRRTDVDEDALASFATDDR